MLYTRWHLEESLWKAKFLLGKASLLSKIPNFVLASANNWILNLTVPVMKKVNGSYIWHDNICWLKENMQL